MFILLFSLQRMHDDQSLIKKQQKTQKISFALVHIQTFFFIKTLCINFSSHAYMQMYKRDLRDTN